MGKDEEIMEECIEVAKELVPFGDGYPEAVHGIAIIAVELFRNRKFKKR